MSEHLTSPIEEVRWWLAQAVAANPRPPLREIQERVCAAIEEDPGLARGFIGEQVRRMTLTEIHRLSAFRAAAARKNRPEAKLTQFLASWRSRRGGSPNEQ